MLKRSERTRSDIVTVAERGGRWGQGEHRGRVLELVGQGRSDAKRSDVVAIPAAAVIAESVVAFVVADAFLEKFGGDSLTEIRRNLDGYLEQVRSF